MLQEEMDHLKSGLALPESIWNLNYIGPRECWGIAEPPAQRKRTRQNILGDFEFSFRNDHDLLPFCYHILYCSVTQSYPILCNPMDCSPPGSSDPGILQAGILGGQPFPSPGDLSDPGIELASPASAGGFFITSAIWEANSIPKSS